MKKANIVFRVIEDNNIQCDISTPQGKKLRLLGQPSESEGKCIENTLGDSKALLVSAWEFAKEKYKSVNLDDEAEQRQAGKRAQKLKTSIEWLADYSDDVTDEIKSGWCSACLGMHDHRKVKRPIAQPSVFLCESCGAPTIPCMAITCSNMALRGFGSISGQRYCAEHKHEITGFEKVDLQMDALNEYEEFLKFDKPNLARATKIVGLTGAGIALATPLAYTAAPAIGGAVGVLVGGFSGAAATSWGLAALAGGSLAAGGLGMAGGTMVVTGVGAAVGGALGATVTHAYVREDKSFHIELLQGGVGTPVVVCNGFLSETGKGWGEWKKIIRTRYPDSPVYRVHWGAKELKDLSVFGGAAVAPRVGIGVIAPLAQRAAKAAAKKLGPLEPVMTAVGLVKNPWHVAKNRAEKTGVLLADLMARTTAESYILVGHSLGARAMVVAAQSLSTKQTAPRIESMHLLGAAIGATGDWTSLDKVVDGKVYNYHSANDAVLKRMYPLVQAGQKAAGMTGFFPRNRTIENIDVTDLVSGHSAYHSKIDLN
ncbi:DUF726 domain-containing protein [Glutamicibacter arilaitensis]|uniref:DUF726 domain-containing protein n=1 Tax=Glutamicibacter arilaitensis TaxID=256701 RepID=UPI003F8F8D07